MTKYYIRLKEEWEESTYASGPVSKWVWSVDFQECEVAKGHVSYGGSVGEKQARKDAEAAATLHAKRESAKIVTYDFTPEG